MSEALQQVLQKSFGLMAQRKVSFLKDGADSFPSGQGDLFFLPARFQKQFIALAQQMRALYVISEAAVSNIFGLLKSQPADVQPLSFAWAWGGERDSATIKHAAVLPLHGNLNVTTVRECVRDVAAAQQSDKDGLFALHPVKFSNTAVAQHWLIWWMSQSR